MKSRPMGITVLSVLTFLNVAVYAVLAVLSVVDTQALAAVLRGFSPGGSGPADLHLRMGRYLPVYYTTMVVITCALALGFWKLRNWARMVVLGLIVVSLIASVPGAFSVVQSGRVGAITLLLVRVGVCVLVGWYLLSAQVREAFRTSGAAAGSQPELPNGSVHHAR